MPEEAKKEELNNVLDSKKPEEFQGDFKICEVWIRSGQLVFEATPEFWRDKFRARGIIAYLDDIVKDAKVPEENKIIVPGNGKIKGIMNFARNFRRKH